MSRTISSDFLAHLTSGEWTIALLIEIIRLDGVTRGFTDHDQDIDYSGLTYLASSGISPSEIEATASLSVDNLELAGPYAIHGLEHDDLVAGKYDGATLVIRVCNYEHPATQVMTLARGILGPVILRDYGFSAEFRSLSQRLQQDRGQIYSPGCRANLGDVRCGVDLDNYTEHGVVIAVDGRTRFAVEMVSRSQPASNWEIATSTYFRYGLITWDKDLSETFSHATSGDQLNDSLSMEIAGYEYGVWSGLSGDVPIFILAGSMPYSIEVGDKFRVAAGCDKMITTCATRFGNGERFRGEPYVPEMDQVGQYGI